MKNAIDRLLTAAVDRGDLHGAAVVVCDRTQVIYQGGCGVADARGTAMAVDTVGAIMSMTKAVTGAAAMQLVEQGRLSLDAPAGEVCPYLSQVEVLEGYAADGAPRLRPPRQPVTLRHLLTHTSGFVYDIWNAEFADYLARTSTPSLGTLRKAALQVPLMFDPGSRWEYGIGIDWAGQMVEAASGMTLGEYLRQHLTGPLSMRDTAFQPSATMTERMAPMANRGDDGTIVLPDRFEAAPGPPAEFEMGGGGLNSTALDYARFVRMVLNDGELDGVRVLKPDTVADMSRNHMGALRVTPLISAMPMLSRDAEFFPGDEKSWGLTFQINEVPGHTGRPAGTLMWAGLSNCYYWIDRANGLGGVLFTQLFPFADPACVDLFYAVEREVYSCVPGQ